MSGKRYLDYFVDPTDNEDRYEINNGKDFVVLKRELATGEALKLQSAGADSMELPRDTNVDDLINQHVRVRMDVGEMQLARVLAYLVDWSIPGPKGGTADISRETVKGLRRVIFDEIAKCVDKQIEKLKKGADAEKEAAPDSDLGKGGTPADAS